MRFVVIWRFQTEEFYFAFPLAINYYRSPNFIYITIAFLFFWLRIILREEKTDAIHP